ncbi:MAG: ribonuclease J [bacterium]|nr:ribonuclease J [bacterium]
MIQTQTRQVVPTIKRVETAVQQHTKQPATPGIKITPLGGLGEVGKNMMVIEDKGKILIVDMGLRMPDEDMPGIDYIIPNIISLKGREKDIVGILITHGHLDHIGAIPYLVGKLGNPPMYASPLAKGILSKRQEDFTAQPKLKIFPVEDAKILKIGPFSVEPFRQNHNINDNFGFVITTSQGNIVHTSDFKFDDNPVNDPPTDYERLKKIGRSKILLLMSDSTNAEQPNHSLSEKVIMENLDEIFKQAEGRIITATFGSLLNRIQQIITLSEKHGRRVAIEGYSMKTNVEIAKQLGYIKAKSGTILTTKELLTYPEEKITILSTGAQGEENAVLMRVINKEHKLLRIHKGDSVIFSSSVIPGNERTVQFVKDQLYRQQATVFHYKMMDIHASGHAGQAELREIIGYIKPKFFMPIHGQFSMMYTHADLAKEEGIPESNIVVPENGNIVNLTSSQISIDKKTVPTNLIMVDGLGVGDVGEIVLRDRQNLAKDGMFVIIVVVNRQKGTVQGSPDIISRGFIYLRESKDLLRDVRRRVVSVVNKASEAEGAVNWVHVRDDIKKEVANFLQKKMNRHPMVLPVIIEV